MSTFQSRVCSAATQRNAMNCQRRLLAESIAFIAIAAVSQPWEHFWMERFEAPARSFRWMSDAMANGRKTHGRWTFKDERHLIALAASQTPLEVVAVEFNRSVNSVRRKIAAMGIYLPVLDEPRPKIGLKAKGTKIAWIDVDHVEESGEYAFRDGVLRIKRQHLNTWKKDPNATFTIVRLIPTTGLYQIYELKRAWSG